MSKVRDNLADAVDDAWSNPGQIRAHLMDHFVERIIGYTLILNKDGADEIRALYDKEHSKLKELTKYSAKPVSDKTVGDKDYIDRFLEREREWSSKCTKAYDDFYLTMMKGIMEVMRKHKLIT